MTNPNDTKMRAIEMREQAEEGLARCVLANIKTFDRLSQTGQPLDDGDRLLIRQALLVAMGNALMGDT